MKNFYFYYDMSSNVSTALKKHLTTKLNSMKIKSKISKNLKNPKNRKNEKTFFFLRHNLKRVYSFK